MIDLKKMRLSVVRTMLKTGLKNKFGFKEIHLARFGAVYEGNIFTLEGEGISRKQGNKQKVRCKPLPLDENMQYVNFYMDNFKKELESLKARSYNAIYVTYDFSKKDEEGRNEVTGDIFYINQFGQKKQKEINGKF